MDYGHCKTKFRKKGRRCDKVCIWKVQQTLKKQNNELGTHREAIFRSHTRRNTADISTRYSTLIYSGKTPFSVSLSIRLPRRTAGLRALRPRQLQSTRSCRS